MSKVIDEWISISDYDFETAKAMLETGRYLYVAFMCQQSIEKLLKAIYVKDKQEVPPRVHNLILLADQIGIELDQDTKHFFQKLCEYYLENRYPQDMQELARSFGKMQAQDLLDKSKDIRKWLYEKKIR